MKTYEAFLSPFKSPETKLTACLQDTPLKILFVFTRLIGDCARSFAGGLARCLAFSAAAFSNTLA